MHLPLYICVGYPPMKIPIAYGIVLFSLVLKFFRCTFSFISCFLELTEKFIKIHTDHKTLVLVS